MKIQELIPYKKIARQNSSEKKPKAEAKVDMKNLLLLVIAVSFLTLILLYITFHEKEDEEDELEPTTQPTYIRTVEERCEDLQVGERMQFSRGDYITLIFASQVSVDQCITFLKSAGTVSKYFNQIGNNFFFTGSGLTSHDLFDFGNVSDVEIFAPGELIVDLTVVVGIGSWDGPSYLISAASTNPGVGSLFSSPYLGDIYYDIEDLALINEFFKESVKDYMFYVADKSPEIGNKGKFINILKTGHRDVESKDELTQVMITEKKDGKIVRKTLQT
eukprot:maker-scaffold_83-snap-gene-0.38-mRNA-1 protein AED:0.00 eAED:0.00 QI:116/1/1/1/1/1/2/44/274